MDKKALERLEGEGTFWKELDEKTKRNVSCSHDVPANNRVGQLDITRKE